ncbi:WD-40 repeat-containing protein [Collybia nuda]|uniref:ASTRA-associated protein 1 n=1 Tax=Collybia nuda TaxID=64659 RepID=A0A9P5YEX2_9AGAR|nr:WD-40 repeat-containing protein [Collybia nuda]
MTEPPPSAPTHLLRSHSSFISAVAFSDDNERLYSGDGSGHVVVTSTRSLRTITSWYAHTDGLLGVEEWGNRVITQARDNKLHVWARIEELPASARLGGSAAQPNLPTPALCFSMDVNALNYCRFSLTGLPRNHLVKDENDSGLLAVPNLVDSSVADIWALPSCQRVHAAIGQAGRRSTLLSGEKSKTGILMSLHLFSASREQYVLTATSSKVDEELRILCAYESGEVTLRRYASVDLQTSVEGAGWEVIWNVKLHVESVMAMRVSRANDLALTVSADHLICRYDISSVDITPEITCVTHRTKHPGNASIAIRDDGKICAVGGWDGKIRLYTTRTLKPLGTLEYHKTSCQVVEFSRSADTVVAREEDESDNEISEDEKLNRTRWLVGGGKDNRVSVWPLISFQKN